MDIRKKRRKTSRIKDIISIIVMSLLSGIFFLSIRKYFIDDPISRIFSYAGIIFGIFSVIIAFFESRSNDPFVTGKTQTFGVINSFVSCGVAIVLISFKFGLVLSSIAISILLFISREMGRESRKRLEDRFIGRRGKIIEYLGKEKYVFESDKEKISVFSTKKLEIGDSVEIYELLGTYPYVRKY